MVTPVPVGPLLGEKLLMVGRGCDVSVKLSVLVTVPEGVMMEIGPVVAPLGTVVVICVAEITLKVAFVLLNLTAVATVKLEPVIVTFVPVGPLTGEKLFIVG